MPTVFDFALPSILGLDDDRVAISAATGGLVWLVWLIPLGPLAASIVTAFAGPRWLRCHSHIPCVAGIALAAAGSLGLVIFGMLDHEPKLVPGYCWLAAGNVAVEVGLRADALSGMMLATVTFVSLLVAVYSIGYVHGDPGYARYFSLIALFVFSMTMLVLANNFLVLYVFWEAVGVCSYFLIGYWYQRPSAAAAAKKAFLVNRIGDFGFAIGIFWLWHEVGSSLHWLPPAGKQILDYDVVFAHAGVLAEQAPVIVAAICLLLFAGAVGKSAQFPLHVWLPDAMEGPSPVSALIHAATMVTAGVYMVARCTPLFASAPDAQLVVASIGGLTALLAALIALTQYDLKRVLAYSTVSQLGFMFMALGAGAAGPRFVSACVIAAMFHLFTHAFFKALLFLSAGSVMHAMGDVIDMRRFGGLRHALPVTHWTFLCGAMALAGVPLLSGFWSKDEILLSLLQATRNGPYPQSFELLLDVALATSFLTAFYTFRAYFLTFWGSERFPAEAGRHPHESPPVMAWPLRILAVLAVAAGLVFGPSHWFHHYVVATPALPAADAPELAPSIVLAGSACAVVGIWLAWWMYVRRREIPAKLEHAWRVPYRVSLNRFFLDELYGKSIVRPLEAMVGWCGRIDLSVLDRLVDLIGETPATVGGIVRRIQNGLVQNYALVMLLGLAILVALVWRDFVT
jgi:NADH-quinone oxidoreductase subunit L